jgi:hypothetical protein
MLKINPGTKIRKAPRFAAWEIQAWSCYEAAKAEWAAAGCPSDRKPEFRIERGRLVVVKMDGTRVVFRAPVALEAPGDAARPAMPELTDRKLIRQRPRQTEGPPPDKRRRPRAANTGPPNALCGRCHNPDTPKLSENRSIVNPRQGAAPARAQRASGGSTMLLLSREAAREALLRGWRILPVPPGVKGCRIKGWPGLVLSLDKLPEYFRGEENLAVVFGARSGGLVDADLDCGEALDLADLYLPPTGAQFGRISKLRSHRLYVAPAAKYSSFVDPLTGEQLLELRADGEGGGAHYTIIPPSIADGEDRVWEEEIVAPAAVEAGVLHQRLVWLAIACLVHRYVSEHAAWNPAPDLPRLLWEFDHDLARPAYAWLGRRTPDQPRRYPRPRPQLSDRDLDLAELVAAIPNDLDWHEWTAMGLRIHAASNGSGDGFVIFDAFSAKSPKYDPHETRKRWRDFNRRPPHRTGIGKLAALARQHGWQPNRRQDRRGAAS